MAATMTPAQQILDEIGKHKKAADDRYASQQAVIEKQQTALDGLTKLLQAPASKAGKSPEQLIKEMNDGGNSGATVVGADGAAYPVPAWMLRKKGVGAGKLWRAAAKRAKHDLMEVSQEEAEATFKSYPGFANNVTKAALAESSGTVGGYTVPPDYSRRLLMLALEKTIVRERATIMPMDSLTLLVPYLDVTTAQSAGVTPFLGGIVMKWGSESTTLDESEPTFRQMELKAHLGEFYTVASNTLLADDAVGLDSLLTQLFRQAISWYTEYAYLQGTGVGQPQGMINAPATIAVTRTTASHIKFSDVATMYSRLLMQNDDEAATIWVAHQSIMPELLQMNDLTTSSSNGGIGRLIFQSIDRGATQKPMWSLLGIPLVFTEKVPKLGTKGDISLFDMSKYVIGDRAEIQIDVSQHVKFLNNQLVWRVLWRGDGQPWLSGAIQLADGSFTVSPFITLAT